jgi:two-component system, NarL family, sensor kinase
MMRWYAAALLGLGLIALTVAGRVLDVGDPTGGPFAVSATLALSFTPMGLLVLVASPGHRVGRLMVAAGLAAAVASLAMSWSGWLPLAWLGQWAWWPPLGLVVLALLYFPDGRLPSPRWRPVAAVVAAATATAALAFAVAALDAPRTLLTAAARAPTDRALVLVRVAVVAIAVTMIGLLFALASLWRRWRRAEGDTRRQLACLIPAAVLLLLGLVLDALGLSGAWLITTAAVPVGMAVAAWRYRLYGLDQIVNRTVVWLVMSLVVIAGFVGLVALLRRLVAVGDASHASLVATGLIAVVFEPLRGRVQRGVDRYLYGERDDPYRVIARLGDLFGRTTEPTDVLPRLTGTGARSLRVPYVALELDEPEGAGTRLTAEHGRATPGVERFELVVHGQGLGRLLVAPRSTGGRFTRRERRLLANVATQAAVAVQATRLIHDLRRSRERLVMAREEERRRLRRELHDGLGPTLAGMSMQVRAAHNLLSQEGRARRILVDLAGDLRRCTAEVRQLVDQLRPPALDAGLEAALRAECRRFDTASLSVQLFVEGDLRGLPAAVEVAAYRIAAEALTNVARHARARNCRVTVRRDGSLTVEVADDGAGVDPARPPGVGLASMRERATELGGECRVVAAVPRGTAVSVRLPMDPEADS